ncbi:MAG: thiamine pyrophosphate-dependent enzyme [Devosia sp.]
MIEEKGVTVTSNMQPAGTRYFDLLASAFLQEEVEVLFALLGDANMYWASRMEERGCAAIHVRHEHCAVAAATAYARVTGRVGVASVTCGPGLTQTMTALPAAAIARIPLVLFAGEPPLRAAWYNQMIEQAPFAIAAGAAYHRLHHPDRMADIVRDAFLQARDERRPVVLGVPMDLQDRMLDADQALPRPARLIQSGRKPIIPNPVDLAEVSNRIAASKRIVVLGGLGATAPGAIAAACQLAANCDGLLATTLPARGLYWQDEFSAGIAGGLATPIAGEILQEADLVIAAGASMAFHTSMGGKFWPKAEVVQISTDPVALSQGRVAADCYMQADATLALEALVDATPARQPNWRTADLARRLREVSPFEALGATENGIHDPRTAVAALDRAIPSDWFLINTSGHISAFTTHMRARPHDRFLTMRDFGAIGNGTSYAMGVAAARPGQPLVLLDGDGSLMMHIQELETMARCGQKILLIALNDGAYGSEIHKLRSRGFSDRGAVFGGVDFKSVAKGFGLMAERLDDLALLPDFLTRFSEQAGPALLDLPISDQIVSPQMDRHARASH